MQKAVIKIISIITSIIILTSCSSRPVTTPIATIEPVTTPTVTIEPVTTPTATIAPVTTPTATNAPVATSTATNAPVIQAEATTNQAQKISKEVDFSLSIPGLFKIATTDISNIASLYPADYFSYHDSNRFESDEDNLKVSKYGDNSKSIEYSNEIIKHVQYLGKTPDESKYVIVILPDYSDPWSSYGDLPVEYRNDNNCEIYLVDMSYNIVASYIVDNPNFGILSMKWINKSTALLYHSSTYRTFTSILLCDDKFSDIYDSLTQSSYINYLSDGSDFIVKCKSDDREFRISKSSFPENFISNEININETISDIIDNNVLITAYFYLNKGVNLEPDWNPDFEIARALCQGTINNDGTISYNIIAFDGYTNNDIIIKQPDCNFMGINGHMCFDDYRSIYNNLGAKPYTEVTIDDVSIEYFHGYDVILQIKSGSKAKTDTNIGIGNSKEDVINVYGLPDKGYFDGSKCSFRYHYVKAETRIIVELTINFTDNKVTNVSFYSRFIEEGDV